ncbi:MAG: ABC transporter ATP-binding protein [Thiolinea sp.]
MAGLLEQVGLQAEHMYRYHQFSGGQRQRIAIARALAVNPKIIVCDEAVSALDVSIQAQVIAYPFTKNTGNQLYFIAHDLPVVRDFADKVVVMQAGRIVEEGWVQAIFENPQQAYTQELLAASLDPDPLVQAERRRPKTSDGDWGWLVAFAGMADMKERRGDRLQRQLRDERSHCIAC